MLHRLILKVTKFQLPPPKRLNTVVKNIFFFGGGGIMPPLSNRVKRCYVASLDLNFELNGSSDPLAKNGIKLADILKASVTNLK